MSNHIHLVACVAIKRIHGGGAEFAYLPNTNISLPKGWEWNVIDGKVDTEDVSGVAASMRFTSLEKTCRLMCQGTDLQGRF